MQSLLIQDNKEFMNQLLLSDLFDRFEMVEVRLVTFCTFSIDGKYVPGYLPEETLSSGSEDTSGMSGAGSFVSWRHIRPRLVELIRGRSKPRSLRIALRLSDSGTKEVLKASGAVSDPSQTAGLYVNISYRNNGPEEKISCVTGTSLQTFSPGKSLDYFWDNMICGFFEKSGIPFLKE